MNLTPVLQSRYTKWNKHSSLEMCKTDIWESLWKQENKTRSKSPLDRKDDEITCMYAFSVRQKYYHYLHILYLIIYPLTIELASLTLNFQEISEDSDSHIPEVQIQASSAEPLSYSSILRRDKSSNPGKSAKTAPKLEIKAEQEVVKKKVKTKTPFEIDIFEALLKKKVIRKKKIINIFC